MILKKINYLSILFLFLLACTSQKKLLNDFKSDGCSLFPDKSLAGHQDWSECCMEHDIKYWMGGTEEQRLIADSLFRQCILEKTGNKKLAEIMYRGVRFGGSPNIPTWYRWGYGWNYIRDYKPLTPAETELVEKRLREYYQKTTRPEDKN